MKYKNDLSQKDYFVEKFLYALSKKEVAQVLLFY